MAVDSLLTAYSQPGAWAHFPLSHHSFIVSFPVSWRSLFLLSQWDLERKGLMPKRTSLLSWSRFWFSNSSSSPCYFALLLKLNKPVLLHGLFLVLRAYNMPISLLGLFGTSCSAQHCSFTAVALQRDPFAQPDLNLSLFCWLSPFGPRTVAGIPLQCSQEKYTVSWLLWQINRVSSSGRMCLSSTLFFWISPKSRVSFTERFLLPSTMQGTTSTSVSEKQLQNKTETNFVKILRMMQFKIGLFSCVWKLGSVCLLNVIKLSANLPKHYSWKTAEEKCSLGTWGKKRKEK